MAAELKLRQRNVAIARVWNKSILSVNIVTKSYNTCLQGTFENCQRRDSSKIGTYFRGIWEEGKEVWREQERLEALLEG